MSCSAVDEALLCEYLLGGLSSAKQRELEAHVSDCPSCRSEADRLQTLLEKLRRMGARRAAPHRPARAVEILALLHRIPARGHGPRRDGAAPRAHRLWPWVAAAVFLPTLAGSIALFPPGRGRELAQDGPLQMDRRLEEGQPAAPQAVEEREEAARRAEEQRAQAVVERKKAEERLAAIEREKARLREASPPTDQDNREEQRRRSAEELARVEGQRAEAEARLEEAKAQERKAVEGARAQKPGNVGSGQRETMSFAAVVERATGDVFLVLSDARTAARAGDGLRPGQGLSTHGEQSAAGVKFPDGTRLELGADTLLRELHEHPTPAGGKAEAGKRVFVARGTVTAVVAGQPRGQPMVFATPHAEATVVGTSLRLVVEAGATRVEVKEGRVRLSRPSDGTGIEMKAGYYAVAAPGAELSAKSLSTAEIFLLPHQGHVSGKVWQVVTDPEACEEYAFQALRGPSRDAQMAQGLSHAPRVSFSFLADAQTAYFVWIRGRANPQAAGSVPQDAVFIDIPGGQFNGQPQSVKDRLGGSAERALFEGFGQRPGYSWIGGDEQDGRHELPVTVRFSRPGVHTLTLHTDETPIWIDAIWISCTQRTRPEEDQKGPWTHKK